MVDLFATARLHIVASALTACLGIGTLAFAQDPQALALNEIKLPKGFTIEAYATDVKNARQMAMGADGVLFVGTRDKGEGQVYAVVDKDNDYKADEVVPIVAGLTQPNGVAYHEGALYVADISTIYRFDNIDKTFRDKPKPVVVTDAFPKDKHHGWKYIGFGPDGKLYVPVGANCNICELTDDIYATITRINPDGSGLEIIAKGVRNSVGFDWDPVTKDLWFTDNGRDLMGDDLPPEELNHVEKTGQHFGFPYVHGAATLDPQFGEGKKPEDYTAPAKELEPHCVALGMKFYTGDMFPSEYKNQVFMAEHGSWNRSAEASKTGYKVTLCKVEGGKVVSYETFAEGWARADKTVWGRPVDVLQMPDGSLLVSDDQAGCIYRISYKK